VGVRTSHPSTRNCRRWGQGEVSQKWSHYANFNTGKERSEFLDWISKVDFEKVHDDIYAKKHGGTGAWLLQRTEFEGWLKSQQSSLLWCYGKREFYPRAPRTELAQFRRSWCRQVRSCVCPHMAKLSSSTF